MKIFQKFVGRNEKCQLFLLTSEKPYTSWKKSIFLIIQTKIFQFIIYTGEMQCIQTSVVPIYVKIIRWRAICKIFIIFVLTNIFSAPHISVPFEGRWLNDKQRNSTSSYKPIWIWANRRHLPHLHCPISSICDLKNANIFTTIRLICRMFRRRIGKIEEYQWNVIKCRNWNFKKIGPFHWINS